MTDEFSRAATQLVASGAVDGGESSKAIAERAARACELLSEHLSRLLGETGVQTLLKRSMMLASAHVPWLGVAPPGDTACATLCAALETREPASATEGFVAVLWMFVGLLKRLIGEGLVERLLHEVWPTIFAPAAKEAP